ncbi:MAG: acetyl/propionyl/methylcrotonyl-CoA carboxylase subunit alpha [Magnetovibrio sp.]|nr:acetyl/propionyl/methylcrotonyl-CoA carboxylase subunit alpha [Magnetovibrio sp.]
MFRKLLIANRGEIACRVMRTAKRMGVDCVAVYSEADRGAPHVAMADEAVLIGPAAAAESYLRAENILKAAKSTGAEAIHPGYGFLSENADFAEAVRAAGLVFVGPPSDAIRAMGGKDNAKRLMEAAGVPVVPGYYGEDQDEATLKAEAGKIGYPVLLKAAMGGGGKGMRAVTEAGELSDALVSARREAEAAFGDGRMLVEKLIDRPRHVEVQVFADGHGNCVHLFERDCSLQRRHQKVIEEAPAPGLSDELRRRMGAAAVAAARAVDYQNAGTIEFLLDADGAFYFMEMNTRLQVEHPVTEMITGQDLVEWQLRVAAGEALPCTQEVLVMRGHAMEARLYAEDPEKGFLPAPGPIHHLRFPATDSHTRIDTGVAAGQEVTAHYDPMIAKVITWDRDREAARLRLIEALGAIELVGPTLNRRFLMALAENQAFAAGEPDTGLIDRLPEDFHAAPEGVSATAVALAAFSVLRSRAEAAALAAARSGDAGSPWHGTDCWRLNDTAHQDLVLRSGEREISVSARPRADGHELRVSMPDGDAFDLRISGAMAADGAVKAEIDGRGIASRVVRVGAGITVFAEAGENRFQLADPMAAAADDAAVVPAFVAPMPGKVVAINVDAGAKVSAGDVLVVLEAMKMEHAIKAPVDGTVTAVHYGLGEQVDEGAGLIEFEED